MSVYADWFTPDANSRRGLVMAAALLVLANFILVIWHTQLLAHFQAGWTSTRILRFALAVSVVPFLATALVGARLVRLGGLMLFLIFAVAFAIGAMEHFVSPGPANAVQKAPGPWTLAFQISVGLLVVLHVSACSLGVWAMRAPPTRPA